MKSLSRRTFVTSAMAVTASVTMNACGMRPAAEEGVPAGHMQPPRPRVIEGDNEERADPREVVCWGDSMTEGMGADIAIVCANNTVYDASFKSYPQILHDLCGLSVINCGVIGATSEDIVAMREDVPFDDESFHYDVYDQDVADLGREHTGDILVAEIGSNGGWDNDYDVLIEQYWRIIEYSGCDDYIVVGDTDDPGTSAGDRNQREFQRGDHLRETDWERALQQEFGGHFVNMRLFLIEHGLEACGIRSKPEDEERALRGCISERLKSDWTHLNSFGYYAKACGIFERGIDLGYWK